GYDTEIAEAGGGLSGGERQRLSVARAILKDAPILILDEPTSSLDAISEEIVFNALRRLRAGRTTIVIAHRLSTIRDADRILVLDRGRVIASGRHEVVLRSSDLYRRMALRPCGLGDRWSFVNYDGSYHGGTRERVVDYARSADLFVNLSGGAWFWRDEYARIPRKIFIDSDPAFTQLAIAKNEPWYVDFFRQLDVLFTFGSNIGTVVCPVLTGVFR